MAAQICPADADIGVPTGTAALALAWAGRAAERAERLTGVAHTVDADRVLAHLLLPLLVGDEVASTAPRPAPAGGWVHTDLIDDDEALYAALTAEHPDADAEDLAAIAQECRLPVLPYREPAPATASIPRDREVTERTRQRVDPRDVTVVDLSAMWAGPLCTMLLAGWGATVIAVDSHVRPDGLRASPRQFAVLARGKQRVDLDLRRAADRDRFEHLVAGADVVVESFSQRVMGNLGYESEHLRRCNPRVVTASLRAFPSDGADRGRVGFGRGVHAASGLGMLGGAPQPVRFAYPDPIAGFALFAAVLDALGRADPPCAIEVSLAGAINELTAAGARPLGGGAADSVHRLRRTVGTDPRHPFVAAAARNRSCTAR
jgi:hypothetical protein